MIAFDSFMRSVELAYRGCAYWEMKKALNSPSRDRHEARDASIVAFAYDVDPIHPKKKKKKRKEKLMAYILELYNAFIASLNLDHYPCLTSCILIPDHIILIPWIWDEVRSIQLNITAFSIFLH